MRRYVVRFTPEAEADLARLYDLLVDADLDAAEAALAAIREALRLVSFSPYACRKADTEHPRLRELVVPFGRAGYVLLFEIEERHVTILAARHQREDDYH
jgi:plasmid stabilization system protein ParE